MGRFGGAVCTSSNARAILDWSFRQKGSNNWLFETVQAASNGTFTVVARLRSTARFVAQWAGDEDRRGAGTPVLKVTVGS